MKKASLIIIVASVFASTSLAAIEPSFQGLNFLDMGGRAVSADGSVVVGIYTGDGGLEAFRWTSDGGKVGLGVLSGDTQSAAFAVSADGSVVVGNSTGLQGKSEAFRWTSDGGMVGLGDLANYAYDVSADGSVVVGSGGDMLEEAFRWTSDSGFVGLGHLGDGGFLTEAFAVSADGSVVVGRSIGAIDSKCEAFRWTSNGGMVGLGHLDGDSYSAAHYVSVDGSIVVGSSALDSNSGERGEGEAFLWTSDGGMVGLGVPSGYTSSYANAVSADGSVVVGGVSIGEHQNRRSEGFLWTSDGGMQNLQEVLEGYGLDLTGWSSLFALDISADGTTITGWGSHDGLTDAWIATIPEPATLLLLGLGGLIIRRRRKP